MYHLLTITLLTAVTVDNVFAKGSEKEFLKPTTTSSGSLAIAAVVGEQAISSFDVNNRIKFILSTTKMSNNSEVIANIKPQVIRTLIDEKLQIQEAEKNSITIDDKEVEKAIAGIEAQRGMPAGEIAKMLAASNIPAQTFNDQIRSQLAWSKLLGRTVRSRIKISDDEVALAQKNNNLSAPTPSPKVEETKIKEVEIAVINLPVDKPQREADAKKLSEKLTSELNKGANFEEVARQFSASGDGKSFWIAPEQLEVRVANALRSTKEGSITAPIRTSDGFSIIKLLHIRMQKNISKNEDKKEPVAAPASADIAREYLFRQKFDLEAQKYMRDLRRKAFIDIR